MTIDPLENAGQLTEAPHLADRDHASTGGTCGALRDEACHLLSCANEHVRKNPVPVVAGAAVLGLALGLLLSNRHEPESRAASLLADLPEHTGDFLSNTLATLRGNLKFW
ncbi:MAG: hypothetical protein EOP87_04265 [Verrucomicrobiaceae bacterium]|nr:MAG: hypothetical protein EOP87_04265 [Verrucomicrobiaceae bacterium]